MKKLKTLLKVLLIAVVSIALWESARYLLSPARQHERYLHSCIETYADYQEVLNTALPQLRDNESPTEERQMILNPLFAYVRGDSPAERIIDIPLANIGDFYRNTYTYGLLWAADYDHLLEKNPDLVLVSLGNGWCAYVSTRTQ